MIKEARFALDSPLEGDGGASPLARWLWLGRRLGNDCRHAFGIDVEGEEGQRLAAGVAPLVDEAEGLVDQRSRAAVRRLPSTVFAPMPETM